MADDLEKPGNTIQKFKHAAEMAEFFLGNPFTRLNNVPTSTQLCSSSAREYTLGGKSFRQWMHNKAMAASGAHVAVKNKKSNTQTHVGPNLSSVTMTRQYVCTLNGGCSSMEQVLNINEVLSLVSGKARDDFSAPCEPQTLDISMSGTFPYTVDIYQIRAYDSKHWTLTMDRFAGVVGTPADCAGTGTNAKVTIYRSGKFIISGGLTLPQFGTLLRSTIKMLKGGIGAGSDGKFTPCFFKGINLMNLQELCGIQKSALIFSDTPGPDGLYQRFKLFGPNRVAIFTPRAETPGLPMPSASVACRERLEKSCKPGGATFEMATTANKIYAHVAGATSLGLSPPVASRLSMMPAGGSEALADIMTHFFPSPPSQSKCKPKAIHKNEERREARRSTSVSMGEWKRVAPWADVHTWEEDAKRSGMSFPGRAATAQVVVGREDTRSPPENEEEWVEAEEEWCDASWNPSNLLQHAEFV